ncbi:MAG: peptidoglycan-binding protein [Pseudomonadota bacterium]|nr:peptidoglycan-binding protein [Pseudomonadota bacterium]
MINRIDLARAAPEQKAGLIYAQARADLSSRLWRAALGDADAGSRPDPFAGGLSSEGGLEALLTVLARGEASATADRAPQSPLPSPEPLQAVPDEASERDGALPPEPSSPAVGLGANQRHQPALEAAARRTGIPAAALSAIVDAEAAKRPDGSWKLYSRNPRSSAAGLGQFLSSTWIGEAERPGTWLNATAHDRGWLTEGGKIAKGARSELLSLRYDAEASINATADYARANLDRLRKAGVAIGGDVKGTAQAAYLGHHLGVGDAIKFLKGGLDPSRARTLLNAQVGSASASRRIAQAGDAAGAHRTWLLDYVGRHIRPTRFEA